MMAVNNTTGQFPLHTWDLIKINGSNPPTLVPPNMVANHNNRGLLHCHQPSTPFFHLMAANNNNRASLHSYPLSLPLTHWIQPLLPRFHLDFHQPLLANHLMKTAATTITNGEYVDFATLLPISSLLEEARNSQLKG